MKLVTNQGGKFSKEARNLGIHATLPNRPGMVTVSIFFSAIFNQWSFFDHDTSSLSGGTDHSAALSSPPFCTTLKTLTASTERRTVPPCLGWIIQGMLPTGDRCFSPSATVYLCYNTACNDSPYRSLPAVFVQE